MSLDSCSIQLFVGLPIDASLASQLATITPQVRSIFFQDGDLYLQMVNDHAHSFIGKFAGRKIDVAALTLLQSNILSLLARLLPHYIPEQRMLLLTLSCQPFFKEDHAS